MGWDPFGDLAKVASAAANTVGGVAHDLVTDPIGSVVKAATALPGAALNYVVVGPVVHAAAQISGRLTEAAGNLVGDKGLASAGKGIYQTDLDIIEGSVRDPVGSAKVIAGTALAVTGVAAPLGVGLAVSGAQSIAAQSMNARLIREGYSTPAMQVPHVDAGARPAQVDATPAPGAGGKPNALQDSAAKNAANAPLHKSLLTRFRDWLGGLLG